MRRAPLIVALVLALVAVACSQSELSLPDDGDSAGVLPDDGVPPDAPTETAVTDPDEVVALALDDVQRFWDQAMPEVYGFALTPLEGGFVPYGPTTEVPQCGADPITYDDIAENAFYCPTGDYIAWDRVSLIPGLQAQFGTLTTGIVIAHEFGHAIQERAQVDGRTVTLELQADCFAGAWVAQAADRIPTFSTDDNALDQAMAGLLELRDALGVSGADPEAHGSGFDRVGAFQDGFERGPSTCSDYEADPPEVVAMPFGSAADARAGGNLPISDLLEPLVADLESFFSALFAQSGRTWTPVADIVAIDPAVDTVDCGGTLLADDQLGFASFFCVDSNTIYLDSVGLIPALEDIGDFAFGGELARMYAFSAQAQFGNVENTKGTDLHADCLAGVYAAAEFLEIIPDQRLVLSPGDLDEIIIAFLAFGSEGTATAFERTGAFRTGFIDGFAACEPLLDA